MLVSVGALLLAVALGQTDAAAADAPGVSAIAPNNGIAAGGTPVRITGVGFEGGATVAFGDVTALSATVTSPTSVLAVSPPGEGAVDVTVTNPDGTSVATAYDRFAYDPVRSGPWLGLNNNTVKYLGAVNRFSAHRIVYDRSFELTAGQLPGELERGAETAELEKRLREDREYGMVPVVVIEYPGYDRPGFTLRSDPEFPQHRTEKEEAAGRNTIDDYVAGFVKSAAAILRLARERYPGMPVLLEAMNEPWAYTTPRFSPTEYANVLAALLPAARAARIPASDIYAAATGRGCAAALGASPEACTANGWVPGLYHAQPALETEIQGWYFHPYGPPSGVAFDDSEGIDSLPLVQSAMTSGQSNILVSEVGYCAEDVNEGQACDGIGVPSATVAASDLTEVLGRALYYHEVGWLRALLVYSRNDGGWAMQNYPAQTLTKAGAALEAFADSSGLGWWPIQSSPDPFAPPFG